VVLVSPKGVHYTVKIGRPDPACLRVFFMRVAVLISMTETTNSSSAQSKSAILDFAGLTATLPPWALVAAAVVSVQVGAAVAKQLFDVAGPVGVVFLRTLLAAAIFWVLWRPRLRGHTTRAYALMVLYGINIALMMLSFYASIDRIPLGVAVAIAFAGPLGLAVAGSRRVVDVLWVTMAALGILLLSPITNADLDPLGVVFALGSALLWSAFVLLSGRVNRALDGNTALALSMSVAALVALPAGFNSGIKVLADPALIALAVVVAVLSSAIPFALEFRALKTMPPRAFGLMVSLEPVVAAMIGFLVLREALGWREVAGIVLVTIAAVATARSTPSPQPLIEPA
jgi:inner membrane transporter RhtA